MRPGVAGGSGVYGGGGRGVPGRFAGDADTRRVGGEFGDEPFVSAFGMRGAPGGLSPGMLALVTVPQVVENLTDRQAAWTVTRVIDWKYGLRLPFPRPGHCRRPRTGRLTRLAHQLAA
ncbi:hypothetical protein GCM10010442_77880 [Kitasatospora kifunensis]